MSRAGSMKRRSHVPGLVVLAAAISAGIHGALVPEHFAEGTAAGAGFLAAAVVLAACAVGGSARPESRLVLVGTAAVFAGLLVSYALAATTGVPVVHPQPEPVDGLALATKAIEALGLLAAASALRRPALVLIDPQPKGT